MDCDSYDISILPEHLLIEIFLWSSVESLLWAKCVCKYWNGLIQDPSFAHRHLQYQKKRKKDRLLLQYFKLDTEEYSYTILDDKTLTSTGYHILDNLQMPYPSLHMEGPIDGLYCLFNGEDRIVLWNPALMDLKTLPLPPSHLSHDKSYMGHIGFGVDPLTNDYKVVHIRDYRNTLDTSRLPDLITMSDTLVSVYNLSTNTWRLPDLGDFHLSDYEFDGNNSSSFLNGTCHWWVVTGGVLAFDMGKETFRVIPGPNNFQSDGIEWNFRSISVYEDHVALLLSNNDLVNIWVMLEEGTWIKQFSIGPIPGLVWPLGFSGNQGPFLILCDSTEHDNFDGQLVLYDECTQEMRNVGPISNFGGFRCCVYYESLISVDGEAKCNGKHDMLKMVSSFLNGDHYS